MDDIQNQSTKYTWKEYFHIIKTSISEVFCNPLLFFEFFLFTLTIGNIGALFELLNTNQQFGKSLDPALKSFTTSMIAINASIFSFYLLSKEKDKLISSIVKTSVVASIMFSVTPIFFTQFTYILLLLSVIFLILAWAITYSQDPIFDKNGTQSLPGNLPENNSIPEEWRTE